MCRGKKKFLWELFPKLKSTSNARQKSISCEVVTSYVEAALATLRLLTAADCLPQNGLTKGRPETSIMVLSDIHSKRFLEFKPPPV
eukprot:UN01357